MSASGLHLEFINQSAVVLVRLDGVIDETNHFADQTPQLRDQKLLVNAERVTRINSCGVRDLIGWVAGLESRGNTLHLVRCSPALMQQVNRIHNLLGHGHVVSFLAPFHCPGCKGDRLENLLSSMFKDVGEAAPPHAICDGCGTEMKFDDPLEGYAAIIRDHARRTVDLEIAGAINRLGDGSQTDVHAARLTPAPRFGLRRRTLRTADRSA